MSRKLSGLNAWVIQRISALYLALFIVAVIVPVLFAPPPAAKRYALPTLLEPGPHLVSMERGYSAE